MEPGLLKIVERYMSKKGNLWGFLNEVDFTIKRLKSDLKESETRENTWASTFIEKVIDKRQNEFDNGENEVLFYYYFIIILLFSFSLE